MLRRLSIALLLALVLAALGSGGYLWYRITHVPPVENELDPLIVSKAKEAGLDPFLVRALIWRESKFDINVPIGGAQERGLMQIRPQVGMEWAKVHKNSTFKPEDLQDPAINLQVGCWYLRQAISHWPNADDPIPFALAEYNAGHTNAREWIDPSNRSSHEAFQARIAFPSTRNYVKDILAKRDQYKIILANSKIYAAAQDMTAASPSDSSSTH